MKKHLNIVHLSVTPLVGAPLRLSRALNLHQNVTSRLITLQRNNWDGKDFGCDLVWDRDREEAQSLIGAADVLHLHNYLHLGSTKFPGLDLSKLWADGKVMVRHFHSTPNLIGHMSGESAAEVKACPIPKLVIAQYQERFYPKAAVVPNIVFPPDTIPARPPASEKIRVCYAPSSFKSARVARWDTKGYPETVKALKTFKAKKSKGTPPIEIDIIENVDHAECLKRKSMAHIAIDELVTGSYHMNTLESLAAGSAVLAFLDDRVVDAARQVTGGHKLPLCNVRLEEMTAFLVALSHKPELIDALGTLSRQWMMDHWAPTIMSARFLDIYNSVLRSPRTEFPARWAPDSVAEEYLATTIHDDLWEARHSLWPKPTPLPIRKAKQFAGTALKRLAFR